MRTFILISASAVALSGCAQSIDAPLSTNFGQAVATMDSQIIPAQISDQPPSSSGAVAAAAVGRYEKGEVKKPETQNTSNVAISGAGYGGGK